MQEIRNREYHKSNARDKNREGYKSNARDSK